MPPSTSLKISTENLQGSSSTTRVRYNWRDENSPDHSNNNNNNISNSDKKRGKQHKTSGVPASSFHRKKDAKANEYTQNLHNEIEDNLLAKSKEEHRQNLEEQRMAFKRITSLKRWPVQDMAMQHLDHLLGNDADHPFHGGECLSAESPSSVSSNEESKSNTTTTTTKSNKKAGHSHSKASSSSFDTKEPLWSLEPRIFATEKAHGKRKYLVGHFGRIADLYWRKTENKHLYEVIRENTPCRLYFDLEYAKAYNENVNEEQLLVEFRQEVAADLKEYFDIILQDDMVIDLDSSTDTKFSRHWIFDLDEQGMFEDAPGVGRFVKRLVGRLAEELATGVLESRRPELAKHLFVQTKDENKTSCFIDLGVYTRNRLFRVLGSSKFGKSTSLQIADTNQYPIELPPKQPPTPKASLEEYIIANDWRRHARVLANTLVVPLGRSEDRHILKVPQNECIVAGFRKTTLTSSQNVSCHPSLPRTKTAISFLPSLDKYVLDVLAVRGGVIGTVRTLSVEYSPENEPTSITYYLARNRYCELIGREHKSNGIFWTVVLGTWICIQGCFDRECFGRGSPIMIPEDRVKAIEEEWQAWKDEEFEKALLSLNLDDICTTKSSEESDSVPELTSEEVPVSKSNKNYGTTTAIQEKDFEQALLALNLEDLSGAKKEYHEVDDDDDDDDDASELSDTALLEAALANPEMFP